MSNFPRADFERDWEAEAQWYADMKAYHMSEEARQAKIAPPFGWHGGSGDEPRCLRCGRNTCDCEPLEASYPARDIAF